MNLQKPHFLCYFQPQSILFTTQPNKLFISFFLSSNLVARIQLFLRWINGLSGFKPQPLHIIMHVPVNWVMSFSLSSGERGVNHCYILVITFYRFSRSAWWNVILFLVLASRGGYWGYKLTKEELLLKRFITTQMVKLLTIFSFY